MQGYWIDIYDFLLLPFYFAVILFHAIYVKNKNIKKHDEYRYYVPGVLCKLIGGISVCLIYTYYYTYGGDVTNYFLTAKAYSIVLLEFDFDLFWEMLNYKTYDIYLTGYQKYDGAEVQFANNDFYALFTSVLTMPFCLLGSKTFIATTMLLAYFSFNGLWRLYSVFVEEFPDLKSQFALAIFFIPSVFFWGSGILKDTYSLSAIGFYTHSVYRFAIKKERKMKYFITLLLSAYVMVSIKPYILFALLPGSLVWIFFNRLKTIRNAFLRALILPIILFALSGTILFSMQLMADYLGEYRLDNVLNKAVKTQQDLIRGEQYGSNNFDIGKFDPTIAGISSKIPVAINLTLFRPYIWDAKNAVMVLSGLENLFMLLFSLYILLRVKTTVLLKSLLSHPLLIFAFLFALFFAFAVGLTTANYGALVRLKIPCIPFYLCSLYILFYFNRESFKRR